MSGLARAAKKKWKRVVKAVKKYWKVVAIAVVAYFTFGLALGAMAPAAGTVTAGAGAASAGTGVMTATAATATSTAAAATTAATVAGIETVTVTAAAAGGGISAAGAAGALAAGGAAAAAGSGGGAVTPAKPAPPQQQAPAEPAAKPGLIDKAKAGWKEMSFSDKLLLTKAGVDVAQAVTGPSAEEEAALAAKWQGAYYGMTADEAGKAQGKTQYVTQQTQPQPQPPATAGGKVGQRDIVGSGGTGQSAADGQQQPGQALPPTQLTQFQSTQQQQQTAPAPAPEQVTNMGGNRDLFAQRAPGVRYLV